MKQYSNYEPFFVEDETGLLTVFKDQLGAEKFIEKECPKGILLNHSGYSVSKNNEKINGGS